MINPMAMARRIKRMAGRRIGLGPFRSVHPVANDFGYGRGTPIDRLFIERFLQEHCHLISGTTLEVGDDAYTARFGVASATRRETIHVDLAASTATYRGDMTQAGVLPDGRFDCAVVTQTLHLIYDMRLAIQHLRQSLAPGGTLLLTVPGISPIAADRWGDGWYWSLTPLSLARLLNDEFGPGNVCIQSFGNAFAATAFLQGIAVEDVESHKLEHHDARFPVIVAAAAIRQP